MRMTIVERLRNESCFAATINADITSAEMAEAADTIEELVEALKTARKQVVAAILSPQMSVDAAEVAVASIDALLCKIGGDR